MLFGMDACFILSNFSLSGSLPFLFSLSPQQQPNYWSFKVSAACLSVPVCLSFFLSVVGVFRRVLWNHIWCLRHHWPIYLCGSLTSVTPSSHGTPHLTLWTMCVCVVFESGGESLNSPAPFNLLNTILSGFMIPPSAGINVTLPTYFWLRH